MQLPPTILSLNNERKKKQDSVTAKTAGKKTTVPKAKPGSKEKSTIPDPPPAPTPPGGDHNAYSDGSDEEGDTIMKEDDDVPPMTVETETAPETSASAGANPRAVKILRHGVLTPPRTLETTLFDRLEKMYGPGIKRLLNVQYRYGKHFPAVCRTNGRRFPG